MRTSITGFSHALYSQNEYFNLTKVLAASQTEDTGSLNPLWFLKCTLENISIGGRMEFTATITVMLIHLFPEILHTSLVFVKTSYFWCSLGYWINSHPNYTILLAVKLICVRSFEFKKKCFHIFMIKTYNSRENSNLGLQRQLAKFPQSSQPYSFFSKLSDITTPYWQAILTT